MCQILRYCTWNGKRVINHGALATITCHVLSLLQYHLMEILSPLTLAQIPAQIPALNVLGQKLKGLKSGWITGSNRCCSFHQPGCYPESIRRQLCMCASAAKVEQSSETLLKSRTFQHEAVVTQHSCAFSSCRKTKFRKRIYCSH